MSFALPEALREYIDARVQSGEYGNTSEYLRDLIRRDQQDQAARRLRDLIAAGLDRSRPSLTKRRAAELRERALTATGEPRSASAAGRSRPHRTDPLLPDEGGRGYRGTLLRRGDGGAEGDRSDARHRLPERR